MSLPGAAELEASLKGAFQLLLQKPEGMSRFDVSLRGYWRSFYAAVFGAPLLLLSHYLTPPVEAVTEAAGTDAAAGNLFFDAAGYLLFYAITWLYWPLAAIYVTQTLGVYDRYIGYIVAYNWAQLLVLIVRASVVVISSVIFGVGDVFLLLIVGLSLYLDWCVARIALAVTGMQAAGMVVMNLVLSVFLLVLLNALAG